MLEALVKKLAVLVRTLSVRQTYGPILYIDQLVALLALLLKKFHLSHRFYSFKLI